MKELETIISYLDDEVTAEEKRAIELELLTNEVLRKDVEFVKEVNSALSDDDYFTYLEKLKAAHFEYSSDEDTGNKIKFDGESRPKQIFMIRWQIISAACVGLIVVISTLVYYNYSHPTNEKLFAEYYSKYEANVLTRSEASDNNDLINAIQLYDRGNYAEAISNFKIILRSDASNTAAHFFLGVSYMETKNFTNAIENLSYVITQNDTVFVEHAQWYIAMCYLKINQIKQAVQILTKISNSNNFYKIMATDLLKKLK